VFKVLGMGGGTQGGQGEGMGWDGEDGGRMKAVV